METRRPVARHGAGGYPRIAARDAAAAQKRLAEARGTTFKECAEKLNAHESAWCERQAPAAMAQHAGHLRLPRAQRRARGRHRYGLVLKVIEPIWQSRTETANWVRRAHRTRPIIRQGPGIARRREPATWRGHLAVILPAQSKIAAIEHHPALPYKDVPAFMARPRATQGVTARALEFTILTAARADETIGALFDEFDVAAKVWTVRAGRTKAGKEHRVPLCDRAIAIVKEMGRSPAQCVRIPRPRARRAAFRHGPVAIVAEHAPRHHRARLPIQLPQFGR